MIAMDGDDIRKLPTSKRVDLTLQPSKREERAVFHVGISPDVPQEDGRHRFDLGLDVLDDAEGVEWSSLPGEIGPEATTDQIRGCDGLLLWGMRVTEQTLEGADRLAIIARLGVGYDNIDVDACTERGIVVTITPDGVRRPMAATTLLLVLAMAHKLLVKDRIARSGSWADKWDHVGRGVTGRTLGLIGAGNIGIDVFRLARPLEMRHIACDPFVSAQAAAEEGFEARRSGHAAAHRRLRRRALPAERADGGADRRRAARADEADRVSDQRGARPDRRRGGAPGSPQRRTHRRRRPGRLRAGAGRPCESDPGARQPGLRAARARPYRRDLPQHGEERVP